MAAPENQLATSESKDGTGHRFRAPTVEELGKWLPQFEIIALIGQGGMGAVYKARQPKLDRVVALKLLPSDVEGAGSGFTGRFEQEARAMAKMSHPNIVTVHDFGETDEGHRYIVMEYVDGIDLHAAVASGQVTVQHALSWIPQICRALQYAHDQGVVHRDIKPANILISREGEVKVGDFGLAKLIDRHQGKVVTQTQVSMGTPDYAAPEALEAGAGVDRRTDVYSLGVLFYELLTGKVPRGAWRPPSAHADIDRRLDAIVVKALQPDPRHRYQSAQELAEALEDVKKVPRMVVPQVHDTGRVVLTGPISRPSTRGVTGTATRRRRKRDMIHPAVVALLAFGFVALALGGVYLYLDGDRFREHLARMTAAPGEPEEDPPPLTPLPPEKVDPVNPGESPANPGNEADPEVVTTPKPELGPRRPLPSKPPVDSESPPSNQGGRLVRGQLQPEDGWYALTTGLDTMAGQRTGDWELRGNGLILSSAEGIQGPFGGKSRVAFLKVPSANYQLRMTLEFPGKPGAVLMHLPCGSRGLGLAIGPVPESGVDGGEVDEDHFLALIGIDGPSQLEDADLWPTNLPVQLQSGVNYELVVRVYSRKEQAAVEAFFDGRPVLRWSGGYLEGGALSLLRGPAKRRISLSSESQLNVLSPEVRAFPEEQWIGMPLPPDESLSPTEILTRPEPLPEPPRGPGVGDLDPFLVELRELGESYVAEEREFALQAFEAEIGKLNESYNAALNRLLESENVTIPVTSAVKRELARLFEGRRIDPEDPPEMPEEVAALRQRYREKLSALEADLNLAIIPLLREHLAEVEALYASAESFGSSKRVLTEIRDVREAVALRLDAAQQARGTENPTAPPREREMEETVPGLLRDATPAFLTRPQFPPVRAEERGEVRVWRRDGTTLPGEPGSSSLWTIPSGLSTTSVAISTTQTSAACLKFNGKVELWGDPVLADEDSLEALDAGGGVVAMDLAESEGIFHLVTLKPDGSVASHYFGRRREIGAYPPEIDDAVSVVALPRGGIALRKDGSLLSWGDVVFEGIGEATEVAKVEAARDLLVALREDGTVLRMGPGAGRFLPGIELLRDVALADTGSGEGIGLLPDGRLAGSARFKQLVREVNADLPPGSATGLRAGNGSLAVQLSDGEWRIYDPSLTSAVVDENEDKAEGCSDLRISGEYIVALDPI